MTNARILKIFLFLMICLLLLGMNSVVAFADMMWEPSMDDFYSKHSEQCENGGNIYTANGAKGYITGMKSPESDVKIVELTNGTTLRVYKTYAAENGSNWGLVYCYDDDDIGDVVFWVSMKDLVEGKTSDIITPVKVLHSDASIIQILLISLVAAVMIVTDVLIHCFWRKDKKVLRMEEKK